MSRFPLHYVAETGGNIVLIESLTMDGGNGPDDFIAFILDTGECLIYQGSDPANAADWSIVGRFRVPPPLNGKCVTRIGGDSLMLTAAGLILLRTTSRPRSVKPKSNGLIQSILKQSCCACLMEGSITASTLASCLPSVGMTLT